jgi:hypothetical protein
LSGPLSSGGEALGLLPLFPSTQEVYRCFSASFR